MSELPQGWTTTSLSTIATVNMGQSPASSTYNEDGIGLPFFQGKAEFGMLYPTVRKWCTEPTKIAEAEDILLSIRAPVGPTNIAKDKCCIGRGLAAIRTIEPLEQRYLLHFFRHIAPWLSQQGTGTTFAAISGEFIRGLDFPLAPLNEQNRIADKLDTLLKRVDTCRDRLDRIPLILKRFRQAVLAAATSGALTVNWREAAGVIGQWDRLTLEDVCTKKRVVTYGVIKLGKETSGGTPCLRTSNVRWLCIDTDGMKRIDPRLSQEYSRTILQGDEVLVNVRGTLGGVAAVTPEMAGWNVSREVAVVPVDSLTIFPKYLAFWIGSESSQRWLSGVERGVAYTGINLEDLRTLPVNLPPMKEQHEIVRRVEKLFAFADKLEARYNTARKQVEQLTPALLSKAFRGELVDQDPNDEPAAVLLERIRAERAGQETKQRRVIPMRSPRKVYKQEPEPLPLAAEPAPAYVDNIPQRILAAMQPGGDYSRADLLAATGISETEWLLAIRQLKADGLVIQSGERRGARYRTP